MKLSRNNGITLISLIVSIIVLLILAGISIVTLTGDNSILRQATNAKEKSDLAQAEERIKLAVNSAYMDENGKLNYEKLITSLQKEFEDGNYEITPSNSNAKSWTITVGKAEVEMKNENYVAPTSVYAYKATSKDTGITDTLVLSSKRDLTRNEKYDYLEVYKNNNGIPYDISDIQFSSELNPPWYNKTNSYIKNVDFIDAIAPTYCSWWFRYCTILENIKNIHNLKTENVTSMNQMFNGCYKLSSLDLSSFNTSNVKDMFGMFTNCSGFKSLNVSKFDTKNVTDMGVMFGNLGGTTNFNNSTSTLEQITGLEKWDTSSVTSMVQMFGGLKYIKSLDLSSFNTSKVTDASKMFVNCFSLKTIKVGDSWDMSNADSTNMFLNCGTNNVTKNN